MLNYNVLNSKPTISLKGINGGEDIWNLLSATYKIPKEFEYQLVHVTRKYIARPDLVSKDVYGVPDHADILCKINGISNPFELNEEMYLIVPEIQCLSFFYNTDDFIGTLTDDDTSLSSTDVKNLQKKKNEPRKANEQIVGDANFRIDRNNKVVIY